MCGRYHVTKSAEEIEAVFGAKMDRTIYRPNYNAAPTHVMPLIANNKPDIVQFFKWGLIPSWSKTEKTDYSMFNAKIETLHEKASYKNLVNKNNCIVITDGYFEWQKLDKTNRQPWRICKSDKSLFAYAGLWTVWKNPENQLIIPNFTIILTDAYSSIRNVHDRMPVMLNPEVAKGWLMNELQVEQLQGEMIKEKDLIYYPVSKDVGKVANNTPELMEEEKS